MLLFQRNYVFLLNKIRKTQEMFPVHAFSANINYYKK